GHHLAHGGSHDGLDLLARDGEADDGGALGFALYDLGPVEHWYPRSLTIRPRPSGRPGVSECSIAPCGRGVSGSSSFGRPRQTPRPQGAMLLPTTAGSPFARIQGTRRWADANRIPLEP